MIAREKLLDGAFNYFFPTENLDFYIKSFDAKDVNCCSLVCVEELLKCRWNKEREDASWHQHAQAMKRSGPMRRRRRSRCNCRLAHMISVRTIAHSNYIHIQVVWSPRFLH